MFLHSFPHSKPGNAWVWVTAHAVLMATFQRSATWLWVGQHSLYGLDRMLWETSDPIWPGGEYNLTELKSNRLTPAPSV